VRAEIDKEILKVSNNQVSPIWSGYHFEYERFRVQFLCELKNFWLFLESVFTIIEQEKMAKESLGDHR
jgi:hypothetical protein